MIKNGYNAYKVYIKLCTYVIVYVKIILKSLVSQKSKRTGYQICFVLMYILYVYMFLICDTQINSSCVIDALKVAVYAV